MAERVGRADLLVGGVIGELSHISPRVDDRRAVAQAVIAVLGDDVAGWARTRTDHCVLGHGDQAILKVVSEVTHTPFRVDRLRAPSSDIVDRTRGQILVGWLVRTDYSIVIVT